MLPSRAVFRTGWKPVPHCFSRFHNVATGPTLLRLVLHLPEHARCFGQYRAAATVDSPLDGARKNEKKRRNPQQCAEPRKLCAEAGRDVSDVGGSGLFARKRGRAVRQDSGGVRNCADSGYLRRAWAKMVPAGHGGLNATHISKAFLVASGRPFRLALRPM